MDTSRIRRVFKLLGSLFLVATVCLQLTPAAFALDTGNVAQTQESSLTTTAALEDNGIPLLEIEGKDRFETAVKISQNTYPTPGSAQGVVIASGYSFPDALAAASIAGIKDYPILPTRPDTLPDVIRQEILRLGAQEVIIVGGEGVVSQQVSTQLALLVGQSNVKRFSGADRHATAEQIYREMEAQTDFSDTLIIATGVDFADSAAIAPFAAKYKSPIFLAKADGQLTAATKQLIEGNPGFTHALIVGGTGRISQDVENYLNTVLAAHAVSEPSDDQPLVVRLSGADRYATSRATADYLVSSGLFSFDTTAIASGYAANFPDALTSAPYLAKNGIPLLLANAPDANRRVLSQFSSEHLNTHGVVFGGLGAVPQLVRLEMSYGPLPLNDATVTTARKVIVKAGALAYRAPVTSSYAVVNWTSTATLFAVPYDLAGHWYQVGFGKDILFYRSEDVTPVTKTGAIVDLSRWNEPYVTEEAYNNLELAILQTNHGSSSVDVSLASYIKFASGCNRHGVPYGAYTYATFSSVAEAQAEAKFFYDLANKPGCYPKFYVVDIESLPADWGSQPETNMRIYTAAFLAQLRIEGAQKVGIYIGHHRYESFNIDYDAFDFVWIPRYGDNTGYMDVEPAFPFDIWQYTSKGHVEGMQYPDGSYGNVDLNAINDRGPNSRQLSWYIN